MEKIQRKQTRGFRAIMPDIDISALEGTILSAFFPEGKNMTIKNLMERTDYSYERANSAVKALSEKKIIKEEKMGKTLVYSLELDNIYSESIGFNAYMLQRKIEFIKKHRIIYGAIREIINNPSIWMIILFGSYSKGTETKQSDVDIICVSDKKQETEHFVKSLKYKYNVNFSQIVLPLHEFPSIKKDNPELWQDLKMYGIIFKGDGYYYYWMYKDEKN